MLSVASWNLRRAWAQHAGHGAWIAGFGLSELIERMLHPTGDAGFFVWRELLGLARRHVAVVDGVFDFGPDFKFRRELRIGRELLQIDIALHFVRVVALVAFGREEGLHLLPIGSSG